MSTPSTLVGYTGLPKYATVRPQVDLEGSPLKHRVYYPVAEALLSSNNMLGRVGLLLPGKKLLYYNAEYFTFHYLEDGWLPVPENGKCPVLPGTPVELQFVEALPEKTAAPELLDWSRQLSSRFRIHSWRPAGVANEHQTPSPA